MGMKMKLPTTIKPCLERKTTRGDYWQSKLFNLALSYQINVISKNMLFQSLKTIEKVNVQYLVVYNIN